MQPYFDALAEADVPVVMVHDDIVWSSGPIFRPAWYRRHVFPHYEHYLAPLLASGKRVLFTADGNYDAFVDDVAATGVHGFVLEPLTNLEAIVRRYGRTHVIVGNADTRVLLSGTRPQIRAEVERCLSLGRDCPGHFLAVGNHIPANTRVGNALTYSQLPPTEVGGLQLGSSDAAIDSARSTVALSFDISPAASGWLTPVASNRAALRPMLTAAIVSAWPEKPHRIQENVL